MKDTELKHFVDSVLDYFKTGTGIGADVGVPYIQNSADNELLEYTGIIGLSGKRRGGVYITSSAAFLADLVNHILKIDEVTVQVKKDMAGELANTIAGNVIEAFGNNFDISVPIVIEGAPKSLALPTVTPTFVIPILWKSHKAFLHVGLN